jgi:hypothetical protein
VFSRGFKAPRAHAQVAGPWCLGPLVAGRFSCSLWRVSRLVPEVWCVCVFALCTRVWVLLDSCTVFFYLNEMTRGSPA